MSIDARMRWSNILFVVGVLLLALLGLSLLGSVQHAWGWRQGEVVEVKLGSCKYSFKRGTLANCEGTWTTSDGTTRTGKVKGNIRDFDERPGSTRAYGDTAYTRPSTWINSWGLLSPFAGGTGVVLLGLALAVRPSRAIRAQARSQPLPAAVTALAEEHRLGTESARFWAKDSVVNGLMAFDEGFVTSWSKEQPGRWSAIRWDRVSGVFERFVRDGRKMSREYVVWIEGEDWLTFAENRFEDGAGLGRTLVECTAQRLRPVIRDALLQGGTYVFPRWGSAALTEVTAAGVGNDDGVLAWSDLTGVVVQDGWIIIGGKQFSLRRSWSDTGNAALLVELLRTFHSQGVR